jgi:hypothetical protein
MSTLEKIVIGYALVEIIITVLLVIFFFGYLFLTKETSHAKKTNPL